MCTVVIRVPTAGGGPVRVLAVRDEDPSRPWRPLGPWWPKLPQVRGVKDELAGGAWLAADDTRLAVLLNWAWAYWSYQRAARIILGAETDAPDPPRPPVQ